MSRKDMEEKILREKMIRRSEIAIKIIMVIAVLFILWVAISWGEVVKHNDEYYLDNRSTHHYSKLNYFEVMNTLFGGGEDYE